MIFSKYKKTCDVILDYPTIGGEDMKYYVRKAIRNILYANIYAHSIRLTSEFPVDGVKCISMLQYNCANMNFDVKSRYDRICQHITYKGGKSAMNYIKGFQNTQDLSVTVGNSYSEYQLMHIFLDKFHQGGKYTAQISKTELRTEKKLMTQKYFPITSLHNYF